VLPAASWVYPEAAVCVTEGRKTVPDLASALLNRSVPCVLAARRTRFARGLFVPLVNLGAIWVFAYPNLPALRDKVTTS
jgi:hypothetical protein